MRALAHPVRISLLELLIIDGPMTATESGERLGESPTTCSFHLRQLARYGFVEEAGGGPGRQRPWKVTSAGMVMGDDQGDHVTALAAAALQRMFLERHLRRLRAWRESRLRYPKVWRDLATENEYVLWVTPEELAEIELDLGRALMRFHERIGDRTARPEGSRPVEVLEFIFPIDLENLGGGTSSELGPA